MEGYLFGCGESTHLAHGDGEGVEREVRACVVGIGECRERTRDTGARRRRACDGRGTVGVVPQVVDSGVIRAGNSNSIFKILKPLRAPDPIRVQTPEPQAIPLSARARSRSRAEPEGWPNQDTDRNSYLREARSTKVKGTDLMVRKFGGTS